MVITGGMPFWRRLSLTPAMAPALPEAPSGLSIMPSPRLSSSISVVDSCATKSSRLTLPSATSASTKPLLPVTGRAGGR